MAILRPHYLAGRRRLVTWAESLAAPQLLCVALIFDAYSGVSAHWHLVLRPLLVTGLVGLVLATGALVVTRNPMRASVVACLALLVLFGHYVLAVAGLAAAAFVLWRKFHPPLRLLLAPLVVLVALTSWRLWDWWVIAPSDFFPAPTQPAEPAAQRGPNVYVLLLDGYPRADSLEDLGISNETFLRDLEDLDFQVAEMSTSPYGHSEMSLAAAMGATKLPPYPDSDDYGLVLTHRHSYRRTYFADTDALAGFRQRGYRLTYIPSPVVHTYWSGWDETRESGMLTDFEASLIQRSPIRFLLGEWVMEQERMAVARGLAAWSGDGLVFAHVMAPHPPFLTEAKPPRCWYDLTCDLWEHSAARLGISQAEYTARMDAQIHSLNDAVVPALERLVTNDPSAVIVVFSDHGARLSESETDEWTRTLFASRTPGFSLTPGVQDLFVRLSEALSHQFSID